jgi:hypothetical protein
MRLCSREMIVEIDEPRMDPRYDFQLVLVYDAPERRSKLGLAPRSVVDMYVIAAFDPGPTPSVMAFP